MIRLVIIHKSGIESQLQLWALDKELKHLNKK